MTPETALGIYEQPALREVTGAAIRPGGLALTDKALALYALPAGAKVLDVGCGAGATVERLREYYHFAALGLDLSASLLQFGHHQNATLPLLQAEGEHLPVGRGLLDAVIAECSLSVMGDADQALDEFRRVLKAGGLLILSDIYARRPEGVPALRYLPPGSCLSGAISQAQIADRLRAHGFQLTLWQDHSDTLKQLAVQLIFAHGSMQSFLQQIASGADSADGSAVGAEIERATRTARPGYYLLLAQKGEV